MYNAIILSDIHLGSSNCQARNLCELLECIRSREIVTEKLILNGDVFDSIDFRRLTKHHWRVLSLVRKLSDQIDIIWICGNHDGSAEIVSHLLGVTVMDEYILTSGSQRILILHGHRFDDFIEEHPLLTWLGDVIYFLLQKIDRTHYFAKMAKKGSKTFVRCARKVEEGAVDYARRKNCSIVCCGHTHHALQKDLTAAGYFNSGCWTEKPCTYLTVAEGRVELHTYAPESSAVELDENVAAAVA